MKPPAGFPVDFVVLWVDGSDPEWQASKRRWQEAAGISTATPAEEDANGACRYNDNGLLRYWFRGVDRFAPWVRRVFFVTSGHRPTWLDESCPRLRVVSHSDFMPAKYLPTFNPRPVHFCLHLIPDLAEHFVLFDDDTFLLRPITPSLYFRKGLPRLPATLRMTAFRRDRNWHRILWNNFYEVNVLLDVSRSIQANGRKWFNPFVLGPRLALSNAIRFRLNHNIPASDFGHLPHPHLKSTFAELWERCPATLERTCMSRFRSHDQVNHWLASSWNLATGRFWPRPPPRQRFVFDIATKTIASTCSAIRCQTAPQICINDSVASDNLDHCLPLLRQAFEDILPGKSSFERD